MEWNIIERNESSSYPKTVKERFIQEPMQNLFAPSRASRAMIF